MAELIVYDLAVKMDVTERQSGRIYAYDIMVVPSLDQPGLLDQKWLRDLSYEIAERLARHLTMKVHLRQRVQWASYRG